MRTEKDWLAWAAEGGKGLGKRNSPARILARRVMSLEKTNAKTIKALEHMLKHIDVNRPSVSDYLTLSDLLKNERQRIEDALDEANVMPENNTQHRIQAGPTDCGLYWALPPKDSYSWYEIDWVEPALFHRTKNMDTKEQDLIVTFPCRDHWDTWFHADDAELKNYWWYKLEPPEPPELPVDAIQVEPQTNDAETLTDVKCDRCGKQVDFEGKHSVDGACGGRCPECGENLCIACAGHWTEMAEGDEPGHAVCDKCYQKLCGNKGS
jgi:hypothetical protein